MSSGIARQVVNQVELESAAEAPVKRGSVAASPSCHPSMVGSVSVTDLSRDSSIVFLNPAGGGRVTNYWGIQCAPFPVGYSATPVALIEAEIGE